MVMTMTRWRIALSVVLALLLVVVAASWSRSRIALDMVSFRDGTLSAPGGDADDPARWSYLSIAYGVNHRRGLIGLVYTRTTAVGTSQAELEPWIGTRGLDSVSVPIGMVPPRGNEEVGAV